MSAVAVLIGVGALVVGAVGGALLMKLLGPQVKVQRDLEQRLRQSEQKLAQYQQEVTEHFTETSRLVNNLTRSYRDVHEYLASSAMKLTNPSVSRAFLTATNGKLSDDGEDVATEPLTTDDTGDDNGASEHGKARTSGPEPQTARPQKEEVYS